MQAFGEEAIFVIEGGTYRLYSLQVLLNPHPDSANAGLRLSTSPPSEALSECIGNFTLTENTRNTRVPNSRVALAVNASDAKAIEAGNVPLRISWALLYQADEHDYYLNLHLSRPQTKDLLIGEAAESLQK